MKLIPRTPINPDDNVGRGMDLALVTLLFLGVGYALDRWLGTAPWFTIGLVVFAVVGQFIAMWYRYEATMRELEAQRAAGSHSHHAASSTAPAASSRTTPESTEMGAA